MRHGDCFMLVYSITDQSSFLEAKSMYNWITRIRDREMPVVSPTTVRLINLKIARLHKLTVCIHLDRECPTSAGLF